MKYPVRLLIHAILAAIASDALRINQLLGQYAACPPRQAVTEVRYVEVPRECPQNDPVRLAARDQRQVGFTAEVSETISLSHNVPVTYDHVVSDPAGVLVPGLGMFQCPDDGTYMMFWSADATRDRAQASLVLQGEVVKYGPLARDAGGTFSGTTTMASVLRCSEGAYAWVRALAWPNTVTCNTIEGNFSSITGAKVIGSDTSSASAFTAELSQNVTSTITQIKYDRVVENIGNDYDVATGEYICPTKGVYAFTVTEHYGPQLTTLIGFPTVLRQNGFEVCKITHSVLMENGDSGIATGTCMAECEEGDRIYLTAQKDTTRLAPTSSFSGFRLDIPDGQMRAFAAEIQTGSDEYVNDQIILFRTIKTNIGGRYLSNFGSYACDDSELYLFFVNVAITSEFNLRSGEVRIMSAMDQVETELKRGPRTERVLKYAFSASATMQVVVRCQVGMAVYVKAVVSGSEPQQYQTVTMFGGFKLPTV